MRVCTQLYGEARTQSADIDVVALSEIDKKAVIGECKFFSLSGYTDWFKTLSDEDVLLLTLDSLYE